MTYIITEKSNGSVDVDDIFCCADTEMGLDYEKMTGWVLIFNLMLTLYFIFFFVCCAIVRSCQHAWILIGSQCLSVLHLSNNVTCHCCCYYSQVDSTTHLSRMTFEMIYLKLSL